MSTAFTVEIISAEVSKVKWANIPLNGTGDPVWFPHMADKCIQVIGTWGGATLLIEGSLDGINFETLNDPFGAALSFSGNKLKQVLEDPYVVRPRVSGGDGTTSLTVYLLGKK